MIFPGQRPFPFTSHDVPSEVLRRNMVEGGPNDLIPRFIIPNTLLPGDDDTIPLDQDEDCVVAVRTAA